MSFLNGTDPGLRQTRTPTVDLFTAGVDFTAGSSTQVTLTNDPGSENNLIVTFDGVTQHRNTYTVSGAVVTFDAAIGSGVSNVEATYTTTQPAQTPADNSVTLAKLADGTQGGLIYYGVSGAPTELAAGTSGQVLQTQGAGANPQWGTVSSDFVLLATNTPSAVSTSDLTAFDNATYNNYLVIGSLTQSSDGQTVGFRVSTDGGSTYRSTTSSYNFGGSKVDDNGSEGLFNATSQTFVHVATSAGAAAGESIGFSLWLYDVADTALKTTFSFTASSFSTDATPRGTGIHGGGSARFTEDVDAIQFLTSSGTISGNLKLYGLK